MRVTRVYVPQPLAPDLHIDLMGPAATHVAHVLRLAAGDPLTLFNGDGHDYPARIVALRGGTVAVAVERVAAACAESPIAVTLVPGIARTERMDFVVQKATELGVAAIQPVLAARGVVRLDAAASARKQGHWQGVAIAACEQCGRARVPSIGHPVALREWLAQPAPAGVLRIQLTPDAGVALAATAAGAGAIEVLIGPEGGLEPAEHGVALAAGYQPCHLGPRVLRSETAALTALAILQAVAGDLGWSSRAGIA
ncbi:MAG: 16S rRNA (uracil(1498)-N(3))-methyltransferase [Gammaproteobacteria bacterium]|nr:16S rRNA (uracil(1498)-N(3))-methyltransferase [Gammaproteobacteria bacterium]